MASSWNEELCEDYGLAFGKDIKAYDVNCILGPSINIQRNPLGGRNFEYYSEDPYLTGKLGARGDPRYPVGGRSDGCETLCGELHRVQPPGLLTA